MSAVMHPDYTPQVYFRAVGNLKRSAEDILTPLNAQLLNSVMTVDSEAKKAKLDPSILLNQYYTQMNATAHLLTGPPLAQITQNVPCGQTTNGSTIQSSSNTTNTAVSRVVHIRNIPPDMADVQLLQLCAPYGSIGNYMMLKGKSQAFVEFEDESAAQGFVAAMTAIPVQVRGRTIFCQFSTHQELKMDKEKKRELLGDEVNHVLQNGSGATASSSVSQLDITGGTQQQPSSVLRVIIENMVYPVTLEVLHSLFSRYGKVLRIITFNKNNTFQALIQMNEASSAQMGKQNLENQNVYNGCCTLRIDYSKLSTLNVKYNNDKSRDYTNPSLPSGEISIEQTFGLTGGIPSLHSLLPAASPYSFAFGAANPAAAFLQQQVAAAGDTSQNALSPYLPSLGALTGSALGPANAINALRFPINVLGLTPVILVSNLDENKVSPDALFTLFGVYGDVLRVKILYNKKDNALIQYSEPQQAQLALQHLDKVRWHDKIVRVAPSKHTNVQMPKEGQPDAGLTRDYSHSPLHRFKKPGSKNYMNIYPPSATLHLSNIPPNVSEQALTEAFENNGFSVKAFKFFPKDHKMALMQLDDVETAIEGLIHMHNHKLAENAHLRVSFSKSGI
ncbi:unnamed protein product [Auanema sp. JU1783]|nr:unnamed protein product [Auanema sp. JU1783]